ncbi:class I SAM-dependent methyltransferase [Embleya sp. NPDC055664]|uniref:class I SAM-dependent methyltransferase n=1 Tax=Embleya sp. NPDC059237 TaxID=3346784 RepID=UPI0036956D65
MPEEPTPVLDKDTIDFDAVYRGEPLAAGGEVAFPVIPWDLGEPQPMVLELVREVAFRDEVLDAGCGLGDNAIMLAGRGLRVTGIDCSATALESARERAAAAGVRVDFVQADATSLTGLDGRRFATVLDSALYHCLGDEDRHRYIAELHRVTEPEAQLHLVCWAEGSSAAARHPMGVSESNLRTTVGVLWDVREIRSTTLSTGLVRDSLTDEQIDRFRQLGATIDRDRAPVDNKGRVSGPAWYLRAVRR